MEQNNVKGKLAKSISCRQGTAICTTYYSYNPSGWVEWVLYKMPGGISDKKISYIYNLQGKVIKKCVTDLASSTLYTYYDYDMAGRLHLVGTNTIDNKSSSIKEAEYTYNTDGTIKRLQLANAQGVDYTYNERSWLTQINHQNLNSTDDPGHDGTNGVAEDLFGEVIGYNDQGHIASGTGFNFQAQYNGNISWIITRTKGAELPDVTAGVDDPIIGYVFNYDAANRLTKADFGYFHNTSGWDNNLAKSAMYELPLINYDANGNIKNLERYGVEAVVTDRFEYHYTGSNNKLTSITNTASGTQDYGYTYDNNGNVLSDQLRGTSNIIYNTANLPEQLTIGTTTVNYWYNADGQRIRKQADGVDEIYVYGADGQTEAVFDASGSLKFFNINTGTENIGRLEAAAYELRLSNVTLSGIYTANNIIAETNVNVTGTAQLKAGVSVTLKPGFRAAEGCSLIVSIDTTLVVESEKYYYVKDHLGSTRVTVDEEGKIASYYDYDPWGMILDGRSGNYGITNEKYKFTGKERDDETNYDYFGARYYDSRIGRWLQVDPLENKHPKVSPFIYCSNNPLSTIDPDGCDDYIFNKNGKLDKYVENDKPDVIMVESGVNDDGEKTYSQLDADATKQFIAIVVGESTNNKEEATGIANVMVNRIEQVGAELKPGFVDKIGGNKDYDAIGGGQYNKVMGQDLIKNVNSEYSSRVEGAISALSPLTKDNTNGAFFWNATSQKKAKDQGWNWKQYNKGIYVKTSELGGTTFFKYNSNKKDNPKFYKNIWP